LIEHRDSGCEKVEALFARVLPKLHPLDPSEYEHWEGDLGATQREVPGWLGEGVGREHRWWSSSEGIADRVSAEGLDVLAFYKSPRHVTSSPMPGFWGIFYLHPAVIWLASRVDAAANDMPGYSLARELLRVHEMAHFRFDLQTLMLEAVKGYELHAPIRSLLRGRRNLFVEEALANRRVWLWSRQFGKDFEQFVFDFMKLQPGAYARFDEDRHLLASEWAAMVVDLEQPGRRLRTDMSPWVGHVPGHLARVRCPEYVVKGSQLQIAGPSRPITQLAEEVV
jgi:hypothetical protein